MHPLVHLYSSTFNPHAYSGVAPPPSMYGRDRHRKGRDQRQPFAPPHQHQHHGRGPPLPFNGGFHAPPPPLGGGWHPGPPGLGVRLLGGPMAHPAMGMPLHLPPIMPGMPPPMMFAPIPPHGAPVSLPLPPVPSPPRASRSPSKSPNPSPSSSSSATAAAPASSTPSPPRPTLIVSVEHDVARELDLPLGSVVERQFVFSSSSSSSSSRLESSVFTTDPEPDEELLAMKHVLNLVKGQLCDIDRAAWGRHTDLTNTCSLVRRAVEEATIDPPTLCTTAFLKMYELLHAYDIIPRDQKRGSATRLRTVHLCEAPGGFVSAFHHFLRRTVHPAAKWTWRANTLDPRHPLNASEAGGAMIADDALRRVTPDSNWLFGADHTGDIRTPDNIRDIWHTTRADFGNGGNADDDVDRHDVDGCGAHVVTCDGSISCASDPAEQESLTSQLHFCETVCALGLLARGGTLVLKMFTFFESPAAHLVRLIQLHFHRLTVAKPACSKGGNSEVYLVATGFRGISSSLLDALLAHCGPFHPSRALLAPSSLSSTFRSELRLCASFFARSSAAVIERNLELFEQVDQATRRAEETRRQACAREFCARFDVGPIASDATPLVDREKVKREEAEHADGANNEEKALPAPHDSL